MIPLDRLLMARGAGETRPVGSASIDRLRQIAAAWHRAVHVDSSMIPVHICDLDAVLADVSAERTRASAAEAECARLTTERDAARRAATFAEMERDTLRGLTDAMRADNVRLRAIVESVRSARAVSAAAAERYTAAWDAVGTMPPTPAQSEEIAAALLAAYEAGDALTAALDAAGEGR